MTCGSGFGEYTMQWNPSLSSAQKPTIAVLVTLLLIPAPPALAASTFKVLHAFSGPDGSGVWSSVVLDAKGNLYGTTSGGGGTGCGGGGCGTVFKLKPQPDGMWTQRVLYRFSGGEDGTGPFGTVVRDPAGNLYGTTGMGGTHGEGTAFELAPTPSGWMESTLYAFCSQPGCFDGAAPYAGLTLDPAGNLYGVSGSVFELNRGPAGWTESVLYRFCSKPLCSDGNGGFASLILDAKGNLYGTTEGGGVYGVGTVFKVHQLPDGTWTERVLHSFGGFPEDGIEPGVGALTFDTAGNLYGTTSFGGSYSGTIFRLVRQPNGHWKETILYNFKGGKAGHTPGAGVVLDKAGNLYGTTFYGGSPDCDCGVAYKLAPNPDGTWSYTVLHRFHGSDGADPDANLILDEQGNLYGTTALGGPGGWGVVFEITP